MAPDPLEPRWPTVGMGGGHYESWYVVAVDPGGPEAVWVRHTVKKRPGGEPTGALWFTWFRPGDVRATKLAELPLSAGPGPVEIGGSTLGLDGCRGATGTASWDLRLESTEGPLLHLPKPWMYSGPLPRTKPTSPRPDAAVSGSFVVDDEHRTFEGWRGMLGHNWGTEHAARWIWLRGALFEDEPSAWIDVVLARVRLGPVLAPWVASGCLSIDGHRAVVGGIGAVRRTSVELRDDGARLRLPSSRGLLDVEVGAPADRFVGWRYADPSGHGHEVVNSSIASMALEVGGTRLRTGHGAVLEVGGDERAIDVELQPFPD